MNDFYRKSLEGAVQENHKSRHKELLCTIHTGNLELGYELKRLITGFAFDEVMSLENKLNKSIRDIGRLQQIDNKCEEIISDYLPKRTFNSTSEKLKYVLEVGSLRYRYVEREFRPEGYDLSRLRKYLMSLGRDFRNF